MANIKKQNKETNNSTDNEFLNSNESNKVIEDYDSEIYVDSDDYKSLSKKEQKEREMKLFERMEGLKKFKKLSDIKKLKEMKEESPKRMKLDESLKSFNVEDELSKEFDLVEKQSNIEKQISEITFDKFIELFCGREEILKFFRKNLKNETKNIFIYFSTSNGYKIGKIFDLKKGNDYKIRKPNGIIKINDYLVTETNGEIKKFGLDIVSNSKPTKKDFDLFIENLRNEFIKNPAFEFDFQKIHKTVEEKKSLLEENKKPEKKEKMEKKEIKTPPLTRKQITRKKIELRTKISKAEAKNDRTAVEMLEKQYESLLTEEDKESWSTINSNRPRL